MKRTNTKTHSFFSMGIPSMCVIFTVLCMVVLALLTLAVSRQDLQTSQVSLEKTTAYYSACKEASEQYQTLICTAREALLASSDCSDYSSRMANATSAFPDGTWISKDQIFSFTQDYTDTLAIYIEVSLPYTPATDISPKLLSWKTIRTADWNPQNRQNIYQKEDSHD